MQQAEVPEECMETEEQKIARDLIRSGRLVFYAKQNEDGDLILRRFRLREEDRPGAPEYVETRLIGLELNIE